MRFRTPVNIDAADSRYGHQDKFVCLGSCFATEIGSRLQRSLFECTTNPLGNLFNPIAIGETLRRSVQGRPFEADEFFQHQELWRHFLVHSSLARKDRDESVNVANNCLLALQLSLKKCGLLILTLGSAWIYEKKGDRRTIGHNHKLPHSIFKKRRLSPAEITQDLRSSITSARETNQSLKVCISVSPVRHARDGLHENNLSKSSLLIATEELTGSLPHCSYFPAYDILLDELRDYRFYAEDLVHPSNLAINFIWEKFSQAYFSDPCKIQLAEIEAIRGMLDHRAQHTDTTSYQTFKSSILKRIDELSQSLPQATHLKKQWSQLP
ncbi:GSCFA domain-containing protein [Pelagicoccus sp. SDUM812002]|uniref:GSCFA domain-containing protein n=1 Tax=Pelagicoccus sp. SDUM812002 TaxID=3041266 RepID=UPI00281009D7|nr:GSCFA domain-containing protein [Pelagicoccus sp. SDUM812002]MDQ8185125.1 GSCFA domain-containing protein [Pelagicoccus sp. SDUM812002]